MISISIEFLKIRHKEWRKVAKKERRRRIRQQNAKNRCLKEEEG